MNKTQRKPTLDRRDAVAQILQKRDDALVVAGLGAPSWDITAAGDNPLNFPTWGAMGGAVMMGLGLALAQPKRRVLVITGDGEMLMGLGSLATVGVQQPKNLAIVICDNEHYGETGMQPTHTGFGVDLAGVAAASNFVATGTVYTPAELKVWIPRLYREEGPLFLAMKVSTDDVPLVLPPRNGTTLQQRFREALLGAEEANR